MTRKRSVINIGDKYNRLTVAAEAGRDHHNQRKVACLCDCGKSLVIPAWRLTKTIGATKSCGCLQLEHAKSQGLKNGDNLRRLGSLKLRQGLRATELSQKYPESRGTARGSYANTLLNSVKQKAKKRGKSWTITNLDAFELFLQPCVYCGQEASFPDTRNGIDRVDNAIGYDPGNCVSCCRQCNSAKLELSLDEFKSYITKVYRLLIGNNDALI